MQSLYRDAVNAGRGGNIKYIRVPTPTHRKSSRIPRISPWDFGISSQWLDEQRSNPEVDGLLTDWGTHGNPEGWTDIPMTATATGAGIIVGMVSMPDKDRLSNRDSNVTHFVRLDLPREDKRNGTEWTLNYSSAEASELEAKSDSVNDKTHNHGSTISEIIFLICSGIMSDNGPYPACFHEKRLKWDVCTLKATVG
ncbi:hypothetical protein B0H14DRAFT_2590013 [Mycena olivaceomarginata]|nr:hypothetical protein B0H14DRAFT_2590013 [Mycena olivaceomarginata]